MIAWGASAFAAAIIVAGIALWRIGRRAPLDALGFVGEHVAPECSCWECEMYPEQPTPQGRYQNLGAGR